MFHFPIWLDIDSTLSDFSLIVAELEARMEELRLVQEAELEKRKGAGSGADRGAKAEVEEYSL